MKGWIGFDAATVTGYAYQLGRTWVTGVVNALDKQELEHVVATAAVKGCRKAVIEDPFFGRNVKTLKKLTRIVDRIQCKCEEHGMHVELVTAQEWQAALGLTEGSADRKAGAMCIAKNLGAHPRVQDEADAVCMTYVKASHARMDELVVERSR